MNLHFLEAIQACESLDELASLAGDFGDDAQLMDEVDARRAMLVDEADKTVKRIAATAKALARPKAPARRLPNSRTELGNVERLLKAVGDNLMYAEDLQAWFEWNGVYWTRTSDGRLTELCGDTVKRIPDEASGILDDDDRIAFLKFAAGSQKKNMIANMAYLAAADSRVRVQTKDLDSNPHLLGVLNGAVDLRTGSLLAPDRSARITVVAAALYDPAATCPLFERTLLDSQGGDIAMASFIQRLLGHSLLGNPTEEIIVIPYGNGSNGKSTIFGAVRNVLGGFARAADAESFMADAKGGANAGRPREDILRLRGARFVYVSEPNENSELKESFVKAMTGGDAMPARGVNAKVTIEVMPTWVPFMPTNHRPIIKGDDFAIWRRIVCIPFLMKFNKEFGDKATGGADIHRKDKLKAESAGILAWLVRGAIAYQAEGLNTPAKVGEAKESYKRDMDLLGDWLEDCCELGSGYTVAIEALWFSWSAFAERRNELGYIKSQKKLSTKLSNRNNGADFVKVENLVYRGKRARGFSGLRLRKADAAIALEAVLEKATRAEVREA